MTSNTTINALSVNSHDLVVSNNGKLNSLSTDNGAIGHSGLYDMLPTSGTLNSNIAYFVLNDTYSNINLPSNPNKGDTLRFVFIEDHVASNLILNSSSTVGEPPYFSPTSYVFIGKVGGGTDGISYSLVTVPTAGQRIFTMTNTGANQCAGVATNLVCTFNGVNWDIQGYIELAGDASAAPTAAFS
tara:strand:- start:386 stop:943 length:558 start_codon:yes stop_codon:yes gene_type:complete